jgi:energy-coupling factor transporter ATP-binding protein EcfA2
MFYCTAHRNEYDALGQDPTTHPFTENASDKGAGLSTADLDALALATANHTFTKVAEHFTSTVLPSVQQAMPDLVKTELSKLVRVAEIKLPDMPAHKIKGTAHKMLPTILQAMMAGASPFIVGPAGSGKTTLAMQMAEVMKLKFYCASRVTSEFKLIGFVDAHGATVRTPFREAYEYGGVFLFDEVDASDPDAMVTFNAGLSNGFVDFPDGLVTKHKDFHAIAAGNTYGRGADRQYVGRNQLDAATLDRFVVFEVDYDEQLEDEVAGNLEWSKYVQAIRRQIELQQVRHIASPRASIVGAKMLACGMDRKVVEDSCIWKGLDASVRRRLESAVKQ